MNAIEPFEPRELTLREILALQGIETKSDRQRLQYQARQARRVLESIEVTYLEPDVIELAE